MKPSILIFIVFTVFNACSTSRESSQNHESPNPDAALRQGSYQLEDLNPQTILFVQDAFKAIEKHQFNTFIDFCNPAIYAAQKSIGIKRDQFIYEIFNLSIPGEDYLSVLDSTIHSIQAIKIESCQLNNADMVTFYTITGLIRLQDESSHAFTIEMIYRNGEYFFTGGVG